MDLPSSTFSSRLSRLRGLPWAGMTALALILGLDLILARAPEEVWRSIARSVPPDAWLVPSRAEQLASLARLRDARPERPLVVFGSSQAGVIFARSHTGPATAVLAQPAGGPREALSLAPLVGRGPGTAAILVGAIDTHSNRPFEAERMGRTLSVVEDLARRGRWRYLWREREEVLRMVTARLLFSYHVRPILHAAGLQDARRFARLSGSAAPPGPELASPALSSVLTQFPRPARQAVLGQTRSLTGMRRDARARLNLDLLEDLVDALRRSGWRIVVVEPPLHPLAHTLYDSRIDLEFRRFVGELEQEGRIDRLVGLDGLPGDRSADFRDLTHMTEEAAARYHDALLPLILDEAVTSALPR